MNTLLTGIVRERALSLMTAERNADVTAEIMHIYNVRRALRRDISFQMAESIGFFTRICRVMKLFPQKMQKLFGIMWHIFETAESYSRESRTDSRDFGSDLREYGSYSRDCRSNSREYGSDSRVCGSDSRKYDSDMRVFRTDFRESHTDSREYDPDIREYELYSAEYAA
ncbi:MAG: hypothetical protein LBK07_02045 [Tannerella sp.]|nr:hypothetical protein [Tannerella sp.]